MCSYLEKEMDRWKITWFLLVLKSLALLWSAKRYHQHLLFWHLTDFGYLQRSSCADIERKSRIYISVFIRRHHWKFNVLTNNVFLKTCEYWFLPFLLYTKIMSYSSFVYIVCLVGFFRGFLFWILGFFLGNNRYRNYLRFYKKIQVLQVISTIEA